MSYAIPFDTLAFVKELESAGVPPAQAEAQVKVLATVMRQVDARVDDLAIRRDKQNEERLDTLADRNEQQVKARLDGLATKQELLLVEANLKRDLKELDLKIVTVEANLKRDIKELETKMETRFKELEFRMVIKTGAMILGGIGFLFGLMRAWPIPVQYVPSASQEMRLPALPPASVSPPAR